MSTIAIGWLSALLAAVLWGSYLVPVRQRPAVDPNSFQMAMAIGILGFGLLVSIATGQWRIEGWGLLSGVIWAAGSASSIRAVQGLGLARGLACWASVSILASAAWGVIAFREPVTIGWAIAGTLTMAAGVAAIGASTASPRTDLKPQDWLLAAMTGLLFGSQAVPFRLSGLGPTEFLLGMSVGIFGAALVAIALGRKRMDWSLLGPGSAAGVAWNVANLSSCFTVVYLGMAVGMPATQLAIVVNNAWAAFYFKEMRNPRVLKQLAGGSALMLAGIILLGIALNGPPPTLPSTP
ncbi:MAG: GRP family sugar transporter [Cyanobacteria bacterium]|nr:GRP family sugar transporter [Cyanobacteriota bacterium]